MANTGRLERIYHFALIIAVLFQIAHAVSLPVVISYDGYKYLQLADILGTNSFAAEWDYLRTPIFPLLLKVAFLVFGKTAAAFLMLQAGVAFLGVWSLAAALKRCGWPWAGVACLPVLTLFPVLVGYEHTVLTETLAFTDICFLASVLLWRTDRFNVKTAVLSILLAIGYYCRITLIWFVPLAAFLYGLEIAESGGMRRNFRRSVIHVIVVLALPFAAAAPWQHALQKTGRQGDQIIYGLVRQAAIPEDSAVLGSARMTYKRAIAESTVDGRFPIGGMRDGREYEVVDIIRKPGTSGAMRLWINIVLHHPLRFVVCYTRCLLSYAGFASDDENALFLNRTLSGGAGPILFPAPDTMISDVRSRFAQPAADSVVAAFIRTLAPVYRIATPVAVVMTIILFVLALLRRDLKRLALAAVPLFFCAIHAFTLNSADRMAAPLHPLFLASGIMLLASIGDRRIGREPHLKPQAAAAPGNRTPDGKRE